jgi:hypothetical protein
MAKLCSIIKIFLIIDEYNKQSKYKNEENMTSTREEKIREEKNDDPISPENLVKYQDQLREIRTIVQIQIPNTRDPARIAVELVINTLEYTIEYLDHELETELKKQLTERKEKAEGKRELDPTYLYMPTLKDQKQAIYIHTDDYFIAYDSAHPDSKDDLQCMRFVKQAMFSSLVVDFIRLFEVAKEVNRVDDFCGQLDSTSPDDPLGACLDARIRTGANFIGRINSLKFGDVLEKICLTMRNPAIPILQRKGYFSYFALLLQTHKNDSYQRDDEYKIATAGGFAKVRLDYFKGVKQYFTEIAALSFKDDFLWAYEYFEIELLPVFFKFVLFHKEELDKILPLAAPIDSLLEQERKKYDEPDSETKDREMKMTITMTVTNSSSSVQCEYQYQKMLLDVLTKPGSALFLNESNRDILFELLERDTPDHCFEMCKIILNSLSNPRLNLSFANQKEIMDRIADLLTKKIYQIYIDPEVGGSIAAQDFLKQNHLFHLLASSDKPDHLSLIYNRIINRDLTLLSPAKFITEVAMVNNSWAFLERLFALNFEDEKQTLDPDVLEAFGNVLSTATMWENQTNFAIRMLRQTNIPIKESTLQNAINENNIDLMNGIIDAIVRTPSRSSQERFSSLLYIAFDINVQPMLIEELFKDHNINFVRNNLPDEKSMVQFLEHDESEDFSDSQIILLQNWERLGLDTDCLAPFMKRLTINDIAQIFFTDDNHFIACSFEMRRQIINEIVIKYKPDEQQSIPMPQEIAVMVEFKSKIVKIKTETRLGMDEKENAPLNQLYTEAVSLLESKEMDNDNKKLIFYWFTKYTDRFENAAQIISVFDVFSKAMNHDKKILSKMFYDLMASNSYFAATVLFSNAQEALDHKPFIDQLSINDNFTDSNGIKALLKLMMLSDEYPTTSVAPLAEQFNTEISNISKVMQEAKEHPESQCHGHLIQLYLSSRKLNGKRNLFDPIKKLIEMKILQELNNNDSEVQHTIGEIQTILSKRLNTRRRPGELALWQQFDKSVIQEIQQALEAAFGVEVIKNANSDFNKKEIRNKDM